MKRPGKYHRKILCPDCKGDKVTMQPTPGSIDPEDYSLQPCTTCKGEGIAETHWTIEYKPIKN